jgi:hypothetical protein
MEVDLPISNHMSYKFLVEVKDDKVTLNLQDTEAMLIAIGISYADAHNVVAHIKDTEKRKERERERRKEKNHSLSFPKLSQSLRDVSLDLKGFTNKANSDHPVASAPAPTPITMRGIKVKCIWFTSHCSCLGSQ